MRVEKLVMHQLVERREVARDHRRKALVFQAENFLFAHRHTSFATCTTRSSLCHCSSSVRRLPWCVLEKPHCGDRQRFSSDTNFAAAWICFLRNSLSSSAPVLLDTRPSTTFLPFGTKRSGSKPPARAVSNSMK